MQKPASKFLMCIKVLIFYSLGIFILFFSSGYFSIPSTWKWIMGLALIGMGTFRLTQLIRGFRKLAPLLLAILMLAGCQENKTQEQTTTSGKFRIVADETIRGPLEAGLEVFLIRYSDISAETSFHNEADAVAQFLAGEADLLWIGRKLDPAEIEQITAQQTPYQPYLVASDAICMLCGPANEISCYSQNGRLGFTGSTPPILIVPDNPSGISKFLKDSVRWSNDSMPDTYAAEGIDSALLTQQKYSQSICMMGQTDASEAIKSDTTLRILPIICDDTACHPVQEDLSSKKYPLSRDIWLISREKGLGPAGGFVSFMTGETGQRILLKEGLLPVYLPSREVIVNQDPL